MVECIFKDGWEIGDQVELVDVAPPQVKEMLLKGDIDATFWVQTWEVLNGFNVSISGFSRPKMLTG